MADFHLGFTDRELAELEALPDLSKEAWDALQTARTAQKTMSPTTSSGPDSLSPKAHDLYPLSCSQKIADELSGKLRKVGKDPLADKIGTARRSSP